MKIVTSVSEWKAIRKTMDPNKTIGYVATMGCLHAGHMSLVKRAQVDNDIVVMTIFVNPAQFNNIEDLERYPRTFEQDKALAESEGVDYILMPGVDEMYPNGSTYQVIEKNSDHSLEGFHRPGHFAGALTIVLKFLLLIKPNKTYFGEKDYEQLELVRGMAEAFLLDVEVVGCSTFREQNGLAMSSRNKRLSIEQCDKASQMAKLLSSSRSCEEVKKALEQEGFTVEYVEEQVGRRFIAAWLDGVRLIDNVVLNQGE